MKTASFYTYTGPGRVSIARSGPRSSGFAGFRVYRALAPGPWFNNVSEAEYRVLYFKQLEQLDPFDTLIALHELAGGSEPHLLCHERAPFHENNWCHRRFVAEWFATTLGIVVPEHEVRGGLKAKL